MDKIYAVKVPVTQYETFYVKCEDEDQAEALVEAYLESGPMTTELVVSAGVGETDIEYHMSGCEVLSLDERTTLAVASYFFAEDMDYDIEDMDLDEEELESIFGFYSDYEEDEDEWN